MNKKGAFTLVELIVVITILAILATIGFVSFSGYLAWTRDTNRIAQLKSMSDALDLYRTKKSLPLPDDKIYIKSGTDTIGYQGYIWKNVLETIEYTEKWLDSKDKIYFSYYLTKNKKYFQLLAFLEEENKDVQASLFKAPENGFGVSETNAIDYSLRYPYTQWRKLWILTDTDNTPIQEILSWNVDISNVWTLELKSYLTDSEYVTWTWTTFWDLKKIAEVGWKWYEATTNHYNFLWTDLDPISCPDWFIPVSSDWEFTTKDFCVAKYEMTYADADTPDSSEDWTNRNTMHYDSSKMPVSMAWKYPIADITQGEAIEACSKIWAHLITNNEWMTIARWIEKVSTNWSSWRVWEWYLYNWVSRNTTLGCDQTWWNSEPRTYATKTWPWSDATCNERRSHRLYNWQIIWDLAWNVQEHVNKANTIDWSWYNVWQTSIAWSSDWTGRDDDWIYDTWDMDKYGSKNHLWIASWMWNLYYADWRANNIFLRWAVADDSSNVGIFTLRLEWDSNDISRMTSFRCVTY